MTTEIDASKRSTPWTVISVNGKEKRIIKRFKKYIDALSYQCICEQNKQTLDITYEVRHLIYTLPD
jgi:hypothetical protein